MSSSSISAMSTHGSFQPSLYSWHFFMKKANSRKQSVKNTNAEAQMITHATTADSRKKKKKKIEERNTRVRYVLHGVAIYCEAFKLLNMPSGIKPHEGTCGTGWFLLSLKACTMQLMQETEFLSVSSA